MGDRSGRYGRPEPGLCTVAPSTGYDQSISRPCGPAAIVFVPWDLLCYYGDRRVVEAALRNDEAFRRKQPAASGGRQAGDHPRGARRLGVAAHDAVDTLQSYEMAPPEGADFFTGRLRTTAS